MAVKWTGLDEYEKELRESPGTLRDQATPLVAGTADAAATEIRAAYPHRTGRLRAGVSVKRSNKKSAPFAVRYTVVNSNPLAWIFEYGTQARHTALGADKGSMPAGKIFIPRAIRHRAGLKDQIRGLLVAMGATVTGS